MCCKPDAAVVCIMNGVGDAFLALAPIRYLRSTLGVSSVFVLTTPEIAATVYGELGDEVLVASPAEGDTTEPSITINELVRRVAGRTRVAWYSLNSYYPGSAAEEQAIRAVDPAVIVRLADEVFHSITEELIQRPMREAFFRVIGISESQSGVSRAPIITSEAESLARSWIGRLGIGSRIVAFHSDTGDEKMWADENWLVLSRLLHTEGFRPIMLGRPSSTIRRCYDLVSVAGFSWHEQVAILAESECFVGVDSCFAHVADGLGIPGLVLFGPSPDAVWGPRGPALWPFIAPGRVMAHLKAEIVARELLERLEQTRSRSPRRLPHPHGRPGNAAAE